MQQQPAIEDNKPTRWERVITDLAAKRLTTRDSLGQLRAQKRDLVLEAAMGGRDAKKRLESVNAELSKLAFEIDDWDVALSQAEQAKRQAEQFAAETAERARLEEMSRLAAAVMRHAAEFTDAIRQAVKAGSVLKMAVANMLARATPEERPQLNRLLEPGSYMRGAEFAGLRSHLEFASYAGPKAHVVALEDALSIFLGRWLQPADSQDPPEGSGNEVTR